MYLIWNIKESIIYYLRLKHVILKSKRLCSKIKMSEYILKDMGSNWIPRVNLDICRKDTIDEKRYLKEQKLIDKFADKYFNDITLQQWNFNIYDEEDKTTKEDLKKDGELRNRFYENFNEIKSNIKKYENEIECHVIKIS